MNILALLFCVTHSLQFGSLSNQEVIKLASSQEGAAKAAGYVKTRNTGAEGFEDALAVLWAAGEPWNNDLRSAINRDPTLGTPLASRVPSLRTPFEDYHGLAMWKSDAFGIMLCRAAIFWHRVHGVSEEIAEKLRLQAAKTALDEGRMPRLSAIMFAAVAQPDANWFNPLLDSSVSGVPQAAVDVMVHVGRVPPGTAVDKLLRRQLPGATAKLLRLCRLSKVKLEARTVTLLRRNSDRVVRAELSRYCKGH